MKRPALTACLLAATAALAGCDQLGIESASVIAARREADGKAVGAACRDAGRGIEDCFALNRKADRAAVYSGWREMNDYMRENKIDATAPQLGPDAQAAATPDDGSTGAQSAHDADKARKPGKKAKPSAS